MSKQQAWQSFLKARIHDPHERQRIANELGVSPITLTRWTSGESTPRLRYVHLLLQLFSEERDAFHAMLMEAFGDVLSENTVREKDVLKDIPSSFYLRIFNAHAAIQPFQRFWSISSSVLQQALGQLDPNHVGLALTVAQCMPPNEQGQVVQSLYERISRGTSPWKSNMDDQTMFLGAESLAGRAVTYARSIVISDFEREQLFPIHRTQWEESAAIYPLLRAEGIAGCLIASSAQAGYFTPSRQTLLERYAELLLLAFEAEAFYPLQQIHLRIMPHQDIQKLAFARFRQRVSTLMKQREQMQGLFRIQQAEDIVLHQLEEELLSLAST